MSRYIDEHRGCFGVEPICAVLDVSASAYHARRVAAPSARAVSDERLLERIREVHRANYVAYGSRRTWKALLRAGEHAPRCQVQRRGHDRRGSTRDVRDREPARGRGSASWRWPSPSTSSRSKRPPPSPLSRRRNRGELQMTSGPAMRGAPSRRSGQVGVGLEACTEPPPGTCSRWGPADRDARERVDGTRRGGLSDGAPVLA